MYGDPTIGGNLGSIFWFISDVAFKWIPGTVVALTGSNPAVTGTPPMLAPITAPVTANDVAVYLASAVDPVVYGPLYQGWRSFIDIITLICLVLGAILVYSLIRIRQIRFMEHQRYLAAGHTIASREVSKTQVRWERVVSEVGSDAEQSWRLAILECDIMLGELLDTLGYKGETMGDKMRQVERADFNTIDLAWEAHRVRNRIAHEGTAHLLNQREARRVVGLYERVFREFRIIE